MHSAAVSHDAIPNRAGIFPRTCVLIRETARRFMRQEVKPAEDEAGPRRDEASRPMF